MAPCRRPDVPLPPLRRLTVAMLAVMVLTLVGTRILVEGPAGSVTSGEPEIGGRTVRQPLDVGLPDRKYTVTWHVLSGDGRPVNDTYTFTVPATTPTSPPPATASPASASSSPTSTGPAVALDDAGTDGFDRRWWWVIGFTALAVAAGVGSWLTRRPRTT